MYSAQYSTCIWGEGVDLRVHESPRRPKQPPSSVLPRPHTSKEQNLQRSPTKCIYKDHFQRINQKCSPAPHRKGAKPAKITHKVYLQRSLSKKKTKSAPQPHTSKEQNLQRSPTKILTKITHKPTEITYKY